MQQLIICKGLPASGKTTFSREWVNEDPKSRIRVNRDDIRRMLGPYWIPTREDLVTEIEEQMLFGALDHKYNVILDATNFRSDKWGPFLYRNNLEKVEVIIKDFTDVPIEVCIERDKNRSKEEQVGEKVIMDMYNKYLKKNE